MASHILWVARMGWTCLYPLLSLVNGPAQEGVYVLVRMSEFEYHNGGLKGQLGIGQNPAMEGHPLLDASNPCKVGLIRVEGWATYGLARPVEESWQRWSMAPFFSYSSFPSLPARSTLASLSLLLSL